MNALLSIEELGLGFAGPSGTRRVLDSVSFAVHEAETVCLVGESGSGKSLTCLAVLGLLPPRARLLGGAVRFAGQDLLALPAEALRTVRGGAVAMIFQDPGGALNPVHRIGSQIAEVLVRHRGLAGMAVRRAVCGLLEQVGLPDSARVARSYPHELSGGMCQRAMIAMALAGEPRLLIADEPTTALDATVQAQILDLLRDIQRARGMSILLVTHDMGVTAELADRVVVMRHGQVVEEGAVRDIFAAPRHPYTRQLLDAAAVLDGDVSPAMEAA